MLCVSARSPDGSSRPAPGHKSTRARDRMGGVHQASLDPTPEACKCTRRHSQHTWGGGDITGSGCWLSEAVLIRRRTGPGRPVYGLMRDQSVHLAEALHPCCVRQGVGECDSTVVGGYGSGLDLHCRIAVWNLRPRHNVVVWSRHLNCVVKTVLSVHQWSSSMTGGGGGEKAKRKLNKSTINMFSHSFLQKK